MNEEEVKLVDTPSTADIINAAASAAREEVGLFASRFPRREDYRPLEELAVRVERAALDAAVRRAARGEGEEGPG